MNRSEITVLKLLASGKPLTYNEIVDLLAGHLSRDESLKALSNLMEDEYVDGNPCTITDNGRTRLQNELKRLEQERKPLIDNSRKINISGDKVIYNEQSNYGEQSQSSSSKIVNTANPNKTILNKIAKVVGWTLAAIAAIATIYQVITAG